MPAVELEVTALAAGGDGIARDAGGRIVFLPGALPGERVLATLVQEKKDFARAVLEEVVVASSDRVEPPCPFVAAGCGGCDWQHVEPSAQRRLKVTIVADALRRIGHIEGIDIGLGPELSPTGYRTTVRGVVSGGHFAFRRRKSHEPIAVDPCMVAHPLLAELIADGDFGTATQVTLRVGARTGERLALLAPTALGAVLPDDVRVVGADELRHGKRAWIHEEVAARTFRISAHSFFQGRPDGADALVDLVAEGARSALAPGATIVDLYAGVGLFARTLSDGHRVVAVEHSASSVADARVNLAGLDARVLRSDVERWHPIPADVVIADPPRTGLGREGAKAIATTGAAAVVLVSCDPAALGRDARMLTEAGYAIDRVTLVDLFPLTAHIEAVAAFSLARPGKDV